MYSVIVDDKVLDFKYKRASKVLIKKYPILKRRHVFYIGNILIGQIFSSRNRGWSCVSDKEPNPLCPVNGFKTRHDAAEFLLKVNGYRDKKE